MPRVNKTPRTTMLMKAVKTGKIDRVKTWLTKSPNCVGIQDEDGKTALMHAAEAGFVDIVRLLVDKEAGKVDKNNKTAYHYAVEKGFNDCAALLISEINNPRKSGMVDTEGRTGLMEAIMNKNIGLAKSRLREAGAQDNQGTTALMYAAELGLTEIVRSLINKEARKTDKKGKTALMCAAIGGFVEIVRMLANEEARMQDQNGKTALIHIIQQSFTEGRLECLEILAPLEKGILWQNRTALMSAIKSGKNHKFAMSLIPHEAGMVSRYENWTALMYLAERTSYLKRRLSKEWVKVMETLLPHEAGKQNCYGMTALMNLSKHNNACAMDLLIPHEAGMQDNKGKTALMYAATEYATNVNVELLIPREVCMQDNTGKTALMHAVQYYQARTVERLAPREAGILDNRGKRAIDYALKSHNKACVPVLLMYEPTSLATAIPFGSPIDVLAKVLSVNDAKRRVDAADRTALARISTALNEAIWSEPIDLTSIREQLTSLANLFPDINLTEIIEEMSTLQYYEDCKICVICLSDTERIIRNCRNCKSTYLCANCLTDKCPTCRSTCFI